jgi:hypothetical protein
VQWNVRSRSKSEARNGIQWNVWHVRLHVMARRQCMQPTQPHTQSLSPRRVFARHHIHVHALSHDVQWSAIKLICLFVFDQRTKNEKCVGTPCTLHRTMHNHQLLAVESASCRLINRLTCSHLPVACITRGPCSAGRILFTSATCKIPSGVLRHVVR